MELEEEYVAKHRTARVERDGNLLDQFTGQTALLRVLWQLRVDGAHKLALLIDLKYNTIQQELSVHVNHYCTVQRSFYIQYSM